jgi:hypothetical protein
MKAAARKLFNKRLKEIFPDPDQRRAFRKSFDFMRANTYVGQAKPFLIHDSRTAELWNLGDGRAVVAAQ